MHILHLHWIQLTRKDLTPSNRPKYNKILSTKEKTKVEFIFSAIVEKAMVYKCKNIFGLEMVSGDSVLQSPSNITENI